MASIISSSSATVKVEKATSEFLIGPDWTLNIDICDTMNSNQMLAKDVLKAVKKRLQHKNPKVQLLALTLLESMVQNCGDYVHFHIAERNILPEMVKIIKKKADMHVRDKILTLIASWNEAFGGSGGRYPQYYMAYEDLRRYGVAFPQHSPNLVPIITPPITRPLSRHPPQPGYGMPSARINQVTAAQNSLSISSISSMREVVDLLADMLQAVDPHDCSAVEDEVIIDLVGQCRANQKQLMQMLTTTGDEEHLVQGLELNDKMQIVLAKHDAIASGSPLPLYAINAKPEASVNNDSSPKSTETSTNGAETSIVKTLAPDFPSHKAVIDEDEEEEDDFTLLARRHSIIRDDVTAAPERPPVSSNAIVPVSTSSGTRTDNQDIIDLLSLTLTTTVPIEHAHTPPVNTMPENQVPLNNQGNEYPQNQGSAFSSYIAPWARPQPQVQTQSHQQQTTTYYPNLQSQQPLYRYRPAWQNDTLPAYETQQSQSRQEVQSQPQPQYTSGYPPPPWAATPGYYSSQSSVMRQPYTFSNARPTFSSNLQVHDSSNGEAAQVGSSVSSSGQKPFIPSYRLFEDLDVFGNENGRFKAGNSAASTSFPGSNNQSMILGQK